MAEYGVTESQIANREAGSNWRDLMLFQIDRTRQMLLAGAPLGRALPGRIGLELRMIVMGGNRILEKLQACGGDVFRNRPVLKASRLGDHALPFAARLPMTPEQYCQDKAAKSGSSFYYSFLFLPPERRRAITALYAFCREVDDVVDECAEAEVARTKLAWWRKEIGGTFAGSAQHPVAQALIPVVRVFNLPQNHFQDIIDGMEMDLSYNRYPDFATLASYCYRVAGVVGLMAAEIFGYRNPATLQLCRESGHGFPAHQHYSRRRRGRAPQSGIPAARRIGALRPFRHRHRSPARQRRIAASDRIPDRKGRAILRTGIRVPASRRSQVATPRAGDGGDLPDGAQGNPQGRLQGSRSAHVAHADPQAVDRLADVADRLTSVTGDR